jgi:hypothetical protein
VVRRRAVDDYQDRADDGGMASGTSFVLEGEDITSDELEALVLDHIQQA